MILDIERLSFSYDKKNYQFKDISFGIERGEVFSILGRNGTGKSTLIKCILNVLVPDAGRISLAGRDVHDWKRQEMASVAAYVPQAKNVVFPFTVFDYVLMGRTPHIPSFSIPKESDLEVAGECLKKFGISHLGDKPVSEISGGEHQMAAIARAVAQGPSLIIMDEPTSHLDMGNQQKVLDMTRKLAADGMAALMTTHFPDHGFMVSDRVAIMEDGRLLASGEPDDVITRENLKTAYGIDVSVSYVPDAGRKVCVTTGCYTSETVRNI